MHNHAHNTPHYTSSQSNTQSPASHQHSQSSIHVQTLTLRINAPHFQPNLHQPPPPLLAQNNQPTNYHMNQQQVHTQPTQMASPIVMVPKMSAPRKPLKRRLCVDFRKVNELQQEVITAGKTKGQISIHPLPKTDEMYAKLKGAKVFSTIDLRSGYHHIAWGKSSRAKTAFVTPFGKYELLMVPFGLAQAPAYFQLLMKKVLKGLDFAMTYLDDIIIFSQNELQHLEHIEVVFSHLWEAGLKMKCSKCDFSKSEIHYLGHLISPEGISPLPNKLARSRFP